MPSPWNPRWLGFKLVNVWKTRLRKPIDERAFWRIHQQKLVKSLESFYPEAVCANRRRNPAVYNDRMIPWMVSIGRVIAEGNQTPCPMATSSSNAFSCAAGCSRYAWPRKGFRNEPKSSVILEGRIFVPRRRALGGKRMEKGFQAWIEMSLVAAGC